jgi:poly(A) polymerase Pap1
VDVDEFFLRGADPSAMFDFADIFFRFHPKHFATVVSKAPNPLEWIELHESRVRRFVMRRYSLLSFVCLGESTDSVASRFMERDGAHDLLRLVARALA